MVIAHGETSEGLEFGRVEEINPRFFGELEQDRGLGRLRGFRRLRDRRLRLAVAGSD